MKQEIREHSFQDETYQIGVDFDGVIHQCSKGFYDGTIYDPPIKGSYHALEALSEEYDIIVYSAKARFDRPLIDGKTGVELIWEWLKKHNMDKFVKDVTAEKPRAVFYIDDKAIRFNGIWYDTFEQLKKHGYLK
jgi:hypothetical protein|tara:strand:- start:604 stop:1005 length:402 start_codon:yes stop_codon:yes gene_type:complete